MKIILSPAKSLDWETPLPTEDYTKSNFPETTIRLSQQLKKLSRNELSDLMGISANLGQLNFERYQEFEEEHRPKNARPAIYAYNGDVYKGLNAYEIPEGKQDYMQNSLRILSGLYGFLKPLDLIQPYRLEMGIKIGIGEAENLYQVWKEKITTSLNEELKTNELFVNLASQEYAKAVNFKQLNTPVISPKFKDFKNGKLKTIAIYAKKARGAMARFAVDNEVNDLDELKNFNYMNYRFSEENTQKENQPVFVR